jgi:hypothetical protein
MKAIARRGTRFAYVSFVYNGPQLRGSVIKAISRDAMLWRRRYFGNAEEKAKNISALQQLFPLSGAIYCMRAMHGKASGNQCTEFSLNLTHSCAIASPLPYSRLLYENFKILADFGY